ncbi:MAG: Long-chain fatty acid--CoA ligase [Myxococcaceae bacterium]|nr:Long-chain fatty acid--CoA ligase [Myxococcaceae bacterium]
MSCNVAQVIRHWALRDPEREAVVCIGADGGARTSLSYAELELRARRAAAYFAHAGLAPGDRIALSMENGLGFLDAWFGGLYAGCTMLPVAPMSAPAELAQRVQHAGCKALVSSEVLWRPGGLAHEALARTAGVLGSVLGIDATELSQHPHAVDAPCPVSPAHLAMLLYTSGTTGTAKGAMITHASLGLHTAALVHHVLGLTSSCRVLAALPLTHSYGIRMTLLAPFHAGGSVVLLPRFRAPQVQTALVDERISWFPGVPTMFHALAHEPSAPLAAPSLRWCLSAGAPLAAEVRRKAEAKLGVKIRQGFGLTEATFSTIATPDDEGGEDTVGRPVFGVEVRIVDRAGKAVPHGEPGEVCVRGQNVMAGYLDDAAATSEALRDGWLHSGDIGRLDAEGRLLIVDRIKDMVLRGGFNVYPAEVEAVLLRHPALRDVAVVGVPDERHGEEVLAAVVVHEGVTLDLRELASFCRSELSRVKLPRLLARLDALPVGASGKVLRRTVREQAVSGVLALEPLVYGEL